MKEENRLKKAAVFIMNYWPLVGIFITIIGFGYKISFGAINNINSQLLEIKEISIDNQQMTLRNTIWNEDIPVEDRTFACDTYLSLGYNSYTKKKCEQILQLALKR